MAAICFETNDTVGKNSLHEEDFFAEVYSDPRIVIGMVMLYLIGLGGIVGLVFIIWLERSGQAGPFRTLVNQLVSFNYEAVMFWLFLIEFL